MTEDSSTVSATLAPAPAPLRQERPVGSETSKKRKRARSFFSFQQKKPRADVNNGQSSLQHIQTANPTEQNNITTTPNHHEFTVHYDPLQDLNQHQKEAVKTSIRNSCFVHAGPGCGKTLVLTRRFAYLVKHHSIPPEKILAVTFANKAAEEMKNRLVALLSGPSHDKGNTKNLSDKLSVRTFHSLCARLLRQYGSAINVPHNFSIADGPDCRCIVRRILKNCGQGPQMRERHLLQSISVVKMDVAGERKLKMNLESSQLEYVLHVRKLYDKELWNMQKLDFDDLLLEMRKLLIQSRNILLCLQNQFEYVLVDEWQDVNRVQFDLISMLAKGNNIFVVGDADQSIYGFRGATGGNEKEFFQMFPQSTRCWLGTNYRSSKCVVQAAQHVIEQATYRPRDKMVVVASREFGPKVQVYEAERPEEEAEFIARTLKQLVQREEISSFSKAAVLFRKNCESQLLEKACIKAGVPYYLRTDVKFYERMEIIDLLAYVRLIVNNADDNAFLRVVNTPKRNIGEVTRKRIADFATKHNMSLDAAATKIVHEHRKGLQIVELRKAQVESLGRFCDLMSDLRKRSRHLLTEGPKSKDDLNTVGDLISVIVRKTRFETHLSEIDKNSSEEDAKRSRSDNVKELIGCAAQYSSILEFFESVALMTKVDRDVMTNGGAVALMTLHGAKGLEYDVVFIAGAEDGLIPLKRPDTDYEEERRLLYVGMTRAKKQLHITWRRQDSRNELVHNKPSRFLREIPDVLANFTKLEASC